MEKILLVILCYFIGAIPFSYIFNRIFGGGDIRKKGSGNVGATNVLRTMGIKIALAALAGDLLKGVLAAWVGLHFGGNILASVCAVAAVIGHCWPAFLGFRGGKGVATSTGIILFLMPKVFLVLLFLFLSIVIISRYVSLGSICGAALFPIILILLSKPLPYLLMGLIMAAIVVYRHKENIIRLRNGTEGKLGNK